jgi:O-antigen/teichoic acid export membrane protein
MSRLLGPVYLLAGIAPRAASFALILVLTRLVPPEEYGRVVLVIATGEALDMVIGGWTRIYSLRAEAGRALTRLRLGRLLALAAGAALPRLLAAALLGYALDPRRSVEFVPSLLAYVASFAVLRLALTLLQLRGRHATYLGLEVGRGALGLLGALGAALLVDASVAPVVLGLSAGIGLMGLVGLAAALAGLPAPRLPRRGYAPALRFALPIVVGMAAVYGLGLFDRYLLTFLEGPAAVAVYAAAYAIARQPIDLVAGSINAVTFPVLMRRYGEGGPQEAARVQAGILVSIATVACGLAAALAALAGPIATLLLPEPYRADAAAVLPWIALGSALFAVKNFVFDNSFHATNRNWLQLASYLPTAVVGIVVTATLIVSHGVVGAAMGFAASGLAALSLNVYAAQRVMPLPLPRARLAAVATAAATAGLAAWALAGSMTGGALGQVLAGGTLSVVVYAAGIVLAGLSLGRLLQTPWAPMPEERTP